MRPKPAPAPIASVVPPVAPPVEIAPRLPTVRDTVEQRRLAREEKSKSFADSRRNRFAATDEPPVTPPVDPATPPVAPVVDPANPPVVPVVDPATPPVAPVVDPATPPVVPAVIPPGEGELNDDDFDDFDDEVVPPAPAPDVIVDPAPEEPADTAAWRERIQEQGRLRKEADARNVDLEQQLEQLREDNTKLTAKSKEVVSSNINWSTHDKVSPMWKSFDDIVVKGAQSFSDAESAKKFRQDSQADLLTEYSGLISGTNTIDERLEADISFKQTLADRYGVDDGSPLVASVRDAMNKYIEIQDTVTDLKKQHDEGRLSAGVQEYHENIKPFDPLFEEMGNVDADFIEANPQSAEAVVGKRYADDAAFRDTADKFKDRVKQFVFGLKPLTQDEINKAEVRATAKGLTVPEYLEARQGNYQKQRAKFLNDVFVNSMAMDEFPRMRKVFDKYAANQRKREAARKPISKSATPSATPVKPGSVKPTRAADRPYTPPSQRSFGG